MSSDKLIHWLASSARVLLNKVDALENRLMRTPSHGAPVPISLVDALNYSPASKFAWNVSAPCFIPRVAIPSSGDTEEVTDCDTGSNVQQLAELQNVAELRKSRQAEWERKDVDKIPVCLQLPRNAWDRIYSLFRQPSDYELLGTDSSSHVIDPHASEANQDNLYNIYEAFVEENDAAPTQSMPLSLFPKSRFDSDSAAAHVQRHFYQRRDQGPLGWFARCAHRLQCALVFDGFPYLRQRIIAAAHASPPEYFDPVTGAKAIRYQAAEVIGRSWLKWKTRYKGDSYAPVLLCYEQEVLNTFTPEHVENLQCAAAISHLVTTRGELAIEEWRLVGIVQHVIDSRDRSKGYSTTAFYNCLRKLFGAPQQLDSDPEVDGALVTLWFQKYFEQARNYESNSIEISLNEYHRPIAFSCLIFAASGRELPIDLDEF